MRIFEIALAKLGLKADEAWMVGDNLEWDIEAPQKVGIFSTCAGRMYHNLLYPKQSSCQLLIPAQI